MENYFDRFHNILPSKNQTQSENPTTFNAAYLFNKLIETGDYDNLRQTAYNRCMTKWNPVYRQFTTMEGDRNLEYSLDEKISNVALANKFKLDAVMKRVRIFTKDISHYNPYVFFFVLENKYPIFKTINRITLIPYLFILKYLVTACVKYKNDVYGESSGAQKAFIMMYGGEMHIEFYLITKYIMKDWYFPMLVYYQFDTEHPTVKSARHNQVNNKYLKAR